MKFLFAVMGLGIAFGAALFSTISGEAGNPLASVVLASLALLMAAVVGLVTVPYLARRVALERLRESLRYEVTRAGVIYVLATLVIGIAALNTGNNLLYIVVAAMLAAMVISGAVSALMLGSLALDVRLPAHVFAQQAVMAEVLLSNPRRILPAFSIQVVPMREQTVPTRKWRLERTTFAFPLNRPAEQQWFRLRDWKMRRIKSPQPEPGIVKGAVYFPYLPGESHLRAELQLSFSRRGRYRESGFGLATRFPFSFFTKTRDIALEREILVYPEIEPTRNLAEISPIITGDRTAFARGRGAELYRIREHMPEDSARHVDWKATAKSGSLKVREFSREERRKICLVFDNPLQTLISESAYERAVKVMASLAWELSAEMIDLSFLVPGTPRVSGIHEFLAILATIKPEQRERKSIDGTTMEGSAEHNVIVTARTPDSAKEHFGGSAQFVFIGRES